MRVYFVDIEYRRVQYKLHIIFHDDASKHNELTLFRIVSGTTGYLPAGYASFLMDGDAMLFTGTSEDFPIDKEKLLEEIIGHVIRLSKDI